MTEYVSKIDIGTSLPIGGDNFDGQWVYSYLVLVDNNVTLSAEGLRTFDLSSYLPDDGYDYEVLFSGSMWTGSTSGNAIGATIAPGTETSYSDEKFLRLGRCNTRSASTHGIYYHGMIPISATDRAVTFCNHDGSGKSGTWYFQARAYRRIGKNSDSTSDYISNINSYPIGGNNFGGQWVFAYKNLINGTALNAETKYTYDLSDYLPDDGYDYEVLLSDCSAYTPASSGGTARLYARNTDGLGVQLLCAITRTNSTEVSINNLIMPISTDRQLIIENSNTKTGNVYIHLYGFRRIGTND